MVDPALALSVFGLMVAALAVVFWPRRGVYARFAHVARLTERVRLEDALKHVYTWEQAGRVTTLESLAGRLEISTVRSAKLLQRLTELGLVHAGDESPSLSEDGRDAALRLVRTHRLWERYLADRTGVPPTEWHDEAERVEHDLSAEQAEALSARLGHPRWDPHGDPIPTPSGDVPEVEQLSLAGALPGRAVEIVHLEDEPREIFDTLLTQGLHLGGRLEVVSRDNKRVRVASGGREWSVGLVAARNVTVRVLAEGESAEGPSETLADLSPGEVGRVLDLSPACRGPQRRRLLDLGVVKGTEITAEMASAAGDPVAYLIRGALIALRRGQAEWVLVERVEAPAEIAS
jgi:DtxR family Mn-dependent transcriptional regulator